MIDPLVEDAGRLFEAGFMLGVIRAMGELPTSPPALEFYRAQRTGYPLAQVIDRFVRRVPDLSERDAGRVLARYYLFKGHLSGLTFLREYLESLVAQAGEGTRKRERARNELSVCYWQCSLGGKNRLEESSEQEQQEESIHWLEQLGLPLSATWDQDRRTGGFLKADLLLWMQHHQNQQHDILVVDTSIATAGSRPLTTDLTIGGELLKMLERDVSYLAEKGAFSRLAIETGAETGPLFTRQLVPYFTAFASSDKESSKLIQAASYAQSFYTFLRRNALLPSDAQLTFHVIGYSGRGVSSMTLRPDQEEVLEACAETYRRGKYDQIELEQATRLEEARKRVFQVIQNKTALLFQDGKAFMSKVTEQLPTSGVIEHTEMLKETFQNTAMLPPETTLRRYDLDWTKLLRHSNSGTPDTRAAHAELVCRALESGRRYLFLTGNPGIGKTTTIATYLKERCHQEGYLLLYASPRKAVNRDILEKFKSAHQEAGDGIGAFYSDQFLGLSANASLIRNAGGQPTVEYVGAPSRLPLQPRGVQFLSSEEVERLNQNTVAGGQRRLVQVAEDTLHDKGMQGAGVVKSICTAIGAALSTTQPNALAAALAIQALKRDEQGRDTLDHLREIFGSAYSRKDNRFLPERMRALATTTRHIIIMIDEITGDDSGYEFFRRVAEWLKLMRLEQYGFRTTIIVSDASITGVEVVRAHFALGQREPDARKIYLTTTPRDRVQAAAEAVSLLPFSFEAEDADDAFLVNSNSYPASTLRLRYQVSMDTLELPDELTRAEQRALLSTWQMQRRTDQHIIQDICALLENRTYEEQIIVYIQDKGRLQGIIEAISKRQEQAGKAFIRHEHYVEIHADSSESERAFIERAEDRDRFAVVFMTSSASRGLTFSKARYILVDVARFSIETNLMEIIQVLYRGRGGSYDLGEKQVTFYLSDRVVLHPDRREALLREGLMSLMTMLSLLKMCVMTRIAGAVSLRDRMVSLIPIGGKSVSGAGQAYHHDVATFQRALHQQMRGARSNDWALTTLYKAISRLMDHAKIQLPPGPGSYLSLYKTASELRLEQWMLSDEAVEDAYVLGNLLLVPVDTATETIHYLGLSREIAAVANEHIRKALIHLINHPRDYSQSVVDGAKAFRQLLKEVEDAERSQRLEQRGGVQRGYYVVPLAMFVAKETIADYCQNLAEREQDESAAALLRSALIHYVRDSYPIDTILPIGSWYREFPFLLITSQDLQALRAKTFQTGHTLMSREMNLLTLLLSDEGQSS
ncbi:MAG TPA: hypothetical protein VFU32_09480 [Ktedonobacterales bacterium]|nr:hypothetical protein [Ktedonobacterales bacterium]